MGFKKSWDVSEISKQIYRMGRESSSPYNDGYTAFEIKKELYEIKFALDQILKDSLRFSGEEGWLSEQEKKRILKHLKS